MAQSARRDPDEMAASRLAARGVARPYDFRTGSELSREELSQLRACGERLAAALGRVMNAYLGCPAQFELTDTRPCTLEECLSAAPRHGATVLIGLAAPGPALLFEIGSALTAPIVSRMLGDPGDPDGRLAPPGRAPTPLEAVLLQRFAQEAMDIWAGTWARLARHHPQALEVLIDLGEVPGRIGASGGAGEGIVVDLDARIAGSADRVRVFLPVSCAQRLVGGSEAADDGRTPLDYRRVRRAGERILLPVSVIVHQMRVPLSEVLGLRPGEVIPLGKPVGEPVTVSVRGRPKFIAQAGVVDGRLAARLLGPCARNGQP